MNLTGSMWNDALKYCPLTAPAERGAASTGVPSPVGFAGRRPPHGKIHLEASVARVWRDGGGLRVVELGSGISAAYGARLLADFGADVIKVESPRIGDSSRTMGPFPGNVPDPERSGMYLYLNFNKRGITLDLGQPEGVRLFTALVADADVLIENLGAGELNRVMEAIALPRHLVVCSISPYGQHGPKAGYLGSELSAAASGGMMGMTGIAEHGPVKQ